MIYGRKKIFLVLLCTGLFFPAMGYAMPRLCARVVGFSIRAASRLVPRWGLGSITPTFTVTGVSHQFHLHQLKKGTINYRSYLQATAQHLRQDRAIVFQEEILPGVGPILVFSPTEGTSKFNLLARDVARFGSRMIVGPTFWLVNGETAVHTILSRQVQVDTRDIAHLDLQFTPYVLPGLDLSHQMEKGLNASPLSGSVFAVPPRGSGEKRESIPFSEFLNIARELNRVSKIPNLRTNFLAWSRFRQELFNAINYLGVAEGVLSDFARLDLKGRVGVVAENPIYTSLKNENRESLTNVTFPIRIPDVSWLTIAGDDEGGRKITMVFPTRLNTAVGRNEAAWEAEIKIRGLHDFVFQLKQIYLSIPQNLDDTAFDLAAVAARVQTLIFPMANEGNEDLYSEYHCREKP